MNFLSGEQGREEGGWWELWTLVSSQGVSTARCRPGTDPGARWRAMQFRSEELRSWHYATHAQRIEPASVERVQKWLDRHPADVPSGECEIGGLAMRVVRGPAGWNCLPA